VVDLAGHRVAVIVVGSGQSGRAVLEYGPVFDKPLPALTKQTGFPNLNFALYASSKASPNQIIITTAKTPFSGTVVKTTVPVGTSKWLVETSATAPLAGTWPNAFPWIMLVAGLTLAVVLGVLVTVLGRRERYAQELVAERTADLEMAQEEIVHRERLSAVGEMATMIGHELRNPLGAAINGLYLVRHNLGDHMEPPVQRGLDLAERETQRAAALADDLTAYMRERRPALEHIPLGTAVDEVLEATPPPAGIEVRVENRDVAVDADSAQLTQMLNNCVTNAYQAMPEGGLVTVGAAASDGHVEILVDDTGPGFEPSTEFRAFDPFFTTKAQGTGLGLAIVQRVAEAHGGSVSLENRDAGGARVVIRLPSADAKAGEAS
jgi:signal transduction histidine kinase